MLINFQEKYLIWLIKLSISSWKTNKYHELNHEPVFFAISVPFFLKLSVGFGAL